MQIAKTAKLDQGTPIMVPRNVGARTMNLNGVVVYSDPGHGVGIRFKNLDPGDEQFLHSELELG